MQSRRTGAVLRHRVVAASVLMAGLLFVAACRVPAEKVTIEISGQQLTVEVARTKAAREHGLMGRRDLGPRDGMIFLFDRDQRLAFWMKDTPTPLSIAFISEDGRILQIEDMQPFSEAVIESRLSARYALEMRQGAFKDLGIGVGDVVKLPDGFPGSQRIEP